MAEVVDIVVALEVDIVVEVESAYTVIYCALLEEQRVLKYLAKLSFAVAPSANLVPVKYGQSSLLPLRSNIEPNAAVSDDEKLPNDDR